MLKISKKLIAPFLSYSIFLMGLFFYATPRRIGVSVVFDSFVVCNILCFSFLLIVQMYTLQELCLDCAGANASYFEVCEFEGVCCSHYSEICTRL